MENLTTIEDTLFVPVMGRIYATEQFPLILKDEKALELKQKLPEHLRNKKVQNQYAALAGAVRSANLDRYIREFLKRNPEGIVAQLSCGLETTFYRCDNGKALWYEIDVPDVIEYRKSVLRESDRERYFGGNAFACEWLAQIRKEFPKTPLLIVAGGLLHYFPHEKIVSLLQRFQSYGSVEIVFDSLNHRGMQRMSAYMKQLGHEDNSSYFCVDDAQELAKEIGSHCHVTMEEKFFGRCDFSGLGFMAKSAMHKANKNDLMKMVALKL